VARMINFHPSRVAACALLTVGYRPPDSGLADFIKYPGQTTKIVGYETFAYMRFFIQPEAAEVIEKNVSYSAGFLHAVFKPSA
jgi:hypothetical protein